MAMKVILIKAMLFLLFVTSPALAAGQVVKEAEVRRVVTEFLRQKCDNLGLEINVKKIGYSGDLALPPGEVSYEVVAPLCSWSALRAARSVGPPFGAARARQSALRDCHGDERRRYPVNLVPPSRWDED